MLVAMDFDAKNYPGSVWEWSAGDRDDLGPVGDHGYPLVLPATENRG